MNALTPNASQYIPPSQHKVFDLSCDKPAQIRQAFVEQGYIVVQNVSSGQDRDRVASLIQCHVKECMKVPPLAELLYDDVLSRVRENPNMKQLFATLLEGKTLMVAFDRCINTHPKNMVDQTLSLHVDQNPHRHLGLNSVQGLLALRGNDSALAVLGVVPGSHLDFVDCRRWHGEDQPWFSLPTEESEAIWDKLRAVHLAEGELVVWDARLMHSRLMGNGKAPSEATTMPMVVVKPSEQAPGFVPK